MYQQKWEAKKETRAYHGDHISERQLSRIWSPKVVGVIPDNPRDPRRLPLASQTFACIEQRLDTVLFRAMLASSVRQAKQVVVHGKVKVNGAQERRPGRLLKPGDLFEVAPAAVIMNVSSPSSHPRSGNKSTEAESEQETTTEPVETKSQSSIWVAMGEQDFVPKPFMSAFAFIPDYLEVDHESCAGVYLREPVARAGSTEVPSPFPAGVHALAANHYQRGR